MRNIRHLFWAPHSLRQRLTLSYALAFVIFLGLTFITLYWSIGAILTNRMQEDLREDIEEFSHLLETSGLQSVIAEMEKETAFDEHEQVVLMLYDASFNLAHATNLQHWQNLNISEAQLKEQLKADANEDLMVISLPSRDSNIHTIVSALSPEFLLVIGESDEEHEDILELLAIVFATVFVLTLPIAALMVWLLTSRAVAGIKAVSDAALKIRSGDLDSRVNMSDQVTEIQTLADTFDSMAQRIQTLIHNMREMTDNIAHDLRSPLGRIRLLSESVLDHTTTAEIVSQTAEKSIAECDRLIRMINVSLDVAETEAGVGTSGKRVLDFSSLLQDTFEDFEAIADQKGIQLIQHACDAATVTGESNALQRMVANILDNSLKYSSAGDSVFASLSNSDSIIQLKIRDTGIGIPASDFEAIFSRFYRVDPSRSGDGCGLGLSYARAVARNHQGDITVESVEGKYTEFTITLPAMTQSTVRSIPEQDQVAAA